MALAHYDPSAIVERRNPHDPPPKVWTEEERANFRKSGFYKKLQEHAVVVHDYQKARDEARRRSDPEFAPRDEDFDAMPVKEFDADRNYYKMLGVDDMASASDIRKAWKKAVLIWHPDKIKQTGTDLTPKKARETFERISLAFEVLSDGPTRRQRGRRARARLLRRRGSHIICPAPQVRPAARRHARVRGRLLLGQGEEEAEGLGPAAGLRGGLPRRGQAEEEAGPGHRGLGRRRPQRPRRRLRAARVVRATSTKPRTPESGIRR